MKLSELLEKSGPNSQLPHLRAIVKSSKKGAVEGEAWVFVYDEHKGDENVVKIRLAGGIYPSKEKPLPKDGDEILLVASKRGTGIKVKQGQSSLIVVVDEQAEIKITTHDEKEESPVSTPPAPVETPSVAKEELVVPVAVEEPPALPLADHAIKWLNDRMTLFYSVKRHIKEAHPSYPDDAIPALATSLYLEFNRSGNSLFKTQGQARREQETEKRVGVKAQLSETKPVEAPAPSLTPPRVLGKPWRETLHTVTREPISEAMLNKPSMIRWAFNKGKKRNPIDDEGSRDFERAILEGIKEVIGGPSAVILTYMEKVIVQYTSKIREQQALSDKIGKEMYEKNMMPQEGDDFSNDKVYEAIVMVDSLLANESKD